MDFVLHQKNALVMTVSPKPMQKNAYQFAQNCVSILNARHRKSALAGLAMKRIPMTNTPATQFVQKSVYLENVWHLKSAFVLTDISGLMILILVNLTVLYRV